MARIQRRSAETRLLDTRLILWAPPSPEDATDVGEVERDAADWLEAGRAWAAVASPGSSADEEGNQGGDLQTYRVEMHRNDSIALDWRFEIMTGPMKGKYLYPQSIGFANGRPLFMVCACFLARKT